MKNSSSFSGWPLEVRSPTLIAPEAGKASLLEIKDGVGKHPLVKLRTAQRNWYVDLAASQYRGGKEHLRLSHRGRNCMPRHPKV